MNRICFMNSNMVWGGGEKWHYESACHLHELGYAVLVITNKGSELNQKLKAHDGIIVESFNINNYSFLNPLKILYFKRLLKREAITTIILGLSTDVKLGGIAAKQAGIKHILYRRGTAVQVKNSILNRYLFRSVLTGVITNSIEIKNKIFQKSANIIDERKVHIIYNGVNLYKWSNLEYSKNSKKDHTSLVLGNAGRLVEQKGQVYLIHIAKKLKEQGVDFKLFIAGSGELEKSLKRDCKAFHLEDEIVFLDFVEDMQEFLQGIDMYLSTSLHEGSSHVIIEAMAAGKPVIAFNLSSMPELIEDNETGYLIPFADIELFVERINYLMHNQLQLNKFGTNSRKLVERKFDFNKNMQQLIEIIEK